MRRRILHITIILFVPLLVNSQDLTSNEKIKINGVVYDAKSSERIPFVHIIDISLNNIMTPVISNNPLHMTRDKLAKINVNYFGREKKQGG